MRLTILGVPRPKGNDPDIIWRNGRAIRLPSKPYRRWYKLAQQQVPLFRAFAREQGVALPIAGRVKVSAVFYRRRGGPGDLDNYFKGLGDALERLGVLVNDRLIASWDGSRLDVDANRPRIELEITGVGL